MPSNMPSNNESDLRWRVPLNQWLYACLLATLVLAQSPNACGQTKSNPTAGFVSTLTVQQRAWLDTHPVIRLGFGEEFAPLLIVDNNGGQSGYLVDLAKQLESQTGLRVDIEVAPMAEIVDGG
jgi:hypothetical protein